MDRTFATAGLKELAGSLEDLEVAPFGEAIEDALWLRDRLDSKIAAALGDFDADQGWAIDGSLSLSAWLSAHAKLLARDAHREAIRAKRLAALPVSAAAWAEGSLSSGQVGAVVANVAATKVALYAGHEAEMTPLLAELSAAETVGAMRTWRLMAEAAADGPERPERASEVFMSQTLDGRREISGHLRRAFRAWPGPSWPAGRRQRCAVQCRAPAQL